MKPGESYPRSIRVTQERWTLIPFRIWWVLFWVGQTVEVTPLCLLLKKEVLFKWVYSCRGSFQKIKLATGENSALSSFSTSRHVTGTTNASEYCLGAVLIEMKDVTVALTSRVLVHQKEHFLSLEMRHWACFCTTWHFSKVFTPRTDSSLYGLTTGPYYFI